MKNNALFSLAVIASLTIVSGSLWYKKELQAVRIRINVKDFPEDGLTLVGPSDPSFNSSIKAMTKGKKNEVIEALKPFSVILKNSDSRAVVGYWLTWEMTKADGTIVTRESGGCNPGVLMGAGTHDGAQLSTSSGYAIRSNSKRFVAPGFSLAEDQGGSTGAFAGGTDDQDAVARIHEAAQDRNLVSSLKAGNAELKGYESITVSIDGAFFEDGTHIGPDTTGFFEKMKASIDAKRDLLEEISFRIDHNKDFDIFDYVQELADSPDARLEADSAASDHYNFYKRIYAHEILRMRAALGDQRALAVALEPLRNRWPKLERK